MNADLVYLANFSNSSVKSIFVLAWKKWFSTERKISYADLINWFFMLQQKFSYTYAFLDVFWIRLCYFVLAKYSYKSASVF